MVSALVYSAPFRREVFLAFMNIWLMKFHEALVNVPYRCSSVSTPEFMDVEWVQGFLLRRVIHRYCKLTADCEVRFPKGKSLYLSQHRAKGMHGVEIVVEPETPHCCQLVADREVYLPEWKSLCLSQHRAKGMHGVEIVVEPETPHCCQLVADREVYLPEWKGCSFLNPAAGEGNASSG